MLHCVRPPPFGRAEPEQRGSVSCFAYLYVRRRVTRDLEVLEHGDDAANSSSPGDEEKGRKPPCFAT